MSRSRKQKGRKIMAKIRHIAYRATDVDAMAKFFVDAMGMKMIQKRKNNAIDLSDGSVNITVLPLRAGTVGRRADQAAGHRPYWFLSGQRSRAVSFDGSGRRQKGRSDQSWARPITKTNSSVLRISSSMSATGRARRRSINNIRFNVRSRFEVQCGARSFLAVSLNLFHRIINRSALPE